MKKSFATTFRSALAAVLCLGAGMAPAALNINEILLFTDDGSATIVNRDNKLWFAVGFYDTAAPANDVVLGITGPTTQKPALSFFLGGSPRTATFHSLGTGAESMYMYFYYNAQPTDYGQGITVDNHNALPSKRVAVLKNGLVVQDTSGTATLGDNNQYSYLDGNAFNTDPGSQAIKINMYQLTSPQLPAGITVNAGYTATFTVRRPAAAAGNTNLISLAATSLNAGLCTVSPAFQPLVGGALYSTFTVQGVSPGATTVRVESEEHPAEFVSIPVTVVQAQPLKITDVQMTTSEGDLQILAQTETLEFKVVLDNPLTTGEALVLSGSTTNLPTLAFSLQGSPREARFNRIGTGANSAAIYFTYTPAPTDYGQGVTLATGAQPENRIAIKVPAGLAVKDNVSGAILVADDQYTAAFGTAFNALATSTAMTINMYKIESPQAALGVTVQVGSSVQVIVKRATGAEANTVPLNLVAQSGNNVLCTVAPPTTTIPTGQSSFLFTVNGLSPGVTNITVYAQDHNQEFVTIPVTVTLSAASRRVTLTPSPMLVGEDAGGGLQMVRVNLGAGSPNPVTLNIAGYIPTKVEGDLLVSIPANQTEGYFYLRALDGPSTPSLTITDSNGFYETTWLSIIVTNTIPTIVSPVENAQLTTVVGRPLAFLATATDPARIYDPLTYSWQFGDNTTGTGTAVTHTYAQPGTYTAVLTVTDGDGGEAIRTITVTVEDGVVLNLASYQSSGLPGACTNGTFVYLNPNGEIWNPDDGNRFPEGFGVKVRAIPAAGCYPFAWIDTGDYLRDPLRTMPGNQLEATITLTDESMDIWYLFSRGFYLFDGFGDIDQDGLSDRWEAAWGKAPPEPQNSFIQGLATDDIGTIAATVPSGGYGANGNLDLDALPMAGTRAIPNIVAGGDVRVFEYPIPWSAGWSGYLPHPDNPFINLIEYRGLEENRGGADGWVRYAMQIPLATSPLRGNDPATDPTLNDTDEDGLDDGWEYYFWTTILYEVSATSDWRAYDATFNLYDADGIPLFQTGVGGPQPQQVIALANAYNQGGAVAAPVVPGTFTVTFDDGTIYTDDGYGRLVLPNFDILNPALGDELQTLPTATVLTIDYGTGDWTVIPPTTATVGANFTIDYELLDGLYDKATLLSLFDPMVGRSTSPGIANVDVDLDGLSNLEEFYLGTNPIHWDTDGDGLPDGWEVDMGLDPLDFEDATANADLDMMAPGHANAYITALQTQQYWNGERAFGFNPGLAYEGGGGLAYTALEEFLVARYYIQLGLVPRVDSVLSPANPGRFWIYWTTDPLDNDTDQDGMPDGWELYVGLPPMFRPPQPPPFDVDLSGVGLDNDGLTPVQEFANATVAALRAADVPLGTNGFIRAFPFASSNWTHKVSSTDPWNSDTDGDGLSDLEEYTESPMTDRNADGNTLVNLCPTSVDTDRDWLPDGWEYFNGLQTVDNAPLDFENATGTYGDPDGDGLANYQEYLAGVNYGWRYDKRYAPDDPRYFTYEGAFRPYDAGDFLRPHPSPVSIQRMYDELEEMEFTAGLYPPAPPADPVYGYTYQEIAQRAAAVGYPGSMQFVDALGVLDFSYGLQPLSWDPAFLAIPPPIAMPYYFLAPQRAGVYATTNPRSPDSDLDGMQDYWEAYHALNPIYGGDIAGGDERRMAGNASRNLAMSIASANGVFPVFGPMARTGDEAFRQYQTFAKWRPDGMAEPTTSAYWNAYRNTWRPYDLVNNPALAGCPFGDADEDGLDNREESYDLFTPDVFSHTDPSPYWLTDLSYLNLDPSTQQPTGPGSHVNLFFAPGSLRSIWWWPYAYNESTAAPAYVYSFEVNEGYDTDNDNISDREELTELNGQGYTDPLDFDSPRSRKAMYFNGTAATRTRNPYFHDKWELTSFSVELWFRAQQPVGRGIQTLIERPVTMPVDDKQVDRGWAIRRNFRLSLTNDGRLRGEFDNDALATFSAETTSLNGTIAPNVWYHAAVTMDSVNNRFNIYLNGALIESVLCDLKPTNGYFPLGYYVDYGQPGEIGSGEASFAFPAPLVVGVSDTNTVGVVDGEYDPRLDSRTFFKGWVDEIRVWDRVRTQADIQKDMLKRYTKDDVAAVNDARYAWEQENIVWVTNNILVDARSDFPVKLLYHFTFDNLPDVAVPSPDRTTVNGSETDEVPYGYDQLSVRPPVADYPGVPWWFDSAVRSRVYNRDYTYVPFIENTAAHLRQYPPFDIASIMPVYDTADPTKVLGYRWRQSMDWLIGGATFNPTNPATPWDLAAELLPNSANPYGFTYRTGLSAGEEVNPMTYGGQIASGTRFESIPIHTDMVPLLDAVADIDVPMWDGFGPGYEVSALDSDGDGMPDWWETANGLDPYDPDGASGGYGDPDGDGLDNWGEFNAGTNPWSADTNGDGYSDYDSRNSPLCLTYGEMYDDSDRMPNDWEVRYGLNPDRYDAEEDLDGDGWTNWEEYMAKTDPFQRSSIPVPSMDLRFLYTEGEAADAPSIIAYTYSERTSGQTMGGAPDGRIVEHRRLTMSPDPGTVLSPDQPVYLPYGKVVPGSAVVTVIFADGTVEAVTIPPFNEELGYFIGPNPIDTIRLYYETGALSGTGRYAGRSFGVTYSHGWTFPATMVAPIMSQGYSVRGGWNRLFGFLDKNSNGDYDVGEPAGLSVQRPVLVSWDSAQADIALSDFLVGYPRIGWTEVGTNFLWNVNEYYNVVISSGSTVAANLYIKRPRNFLHEGDLIAAGVNGLPFGAAKSATFMYSVTLGTTIVSQGSFTYVLETPQEPRRAMTALQPVQGEVVYTPNVEFKWKMDYRNEGARIVIKNKATLATVYDGLVNLPVRHGRTTSADYYFSAVPQTLNGKSYFSLPKGAYTYTITEHVNTTAFAKQSVTGWFQIGEPAADPGCPEPAGGRESYSISGTVYYFGKAEMAETKTDLHVFSGAQSAVSGVVPGTAAIIPGTVSLRVVKPDGSVVESLNDSNADGALLSESGSALSAGIDYTTRAYNVAFPANIPTGYKLIYVDKTFLKDVVITAYKLPDSATSCFGFSGTPMGRLITRDKGNYTFTGLPSGKYAIRAFLDSNGNKQLDDWETYGMVGNGPIQGPVLYTSYPPIDLPSSKLGMDVVLRDRDTDNDMLPDAWEWQHFGSISLKSGYDQVEPDLLLRREYADGPLDSDPNRVDTDGDGLSDGVELNLTRTDTHVTDTDRDGVTDLEEFLAGGDPLDGASREVFKTLGVEFDSNGNPYVYCPYPALARGITVSYLLKYKPELAAADWSVVEEASVAAPDVPNGALPAGALIMTPPPAAVDWKNGFFKIDVQVDYGTWTVN